MRIHLLDTIVIVLYFVFTLWLGIWVSKKNKNTESYFLGKRNFPGWAIGVSFIGAMISSITFIAIPADSFKTAWVRFLPNLAFPLVVLISVYFFLPFFRRGTVTSAYEYLALRFGPSISAYGATVYLVAQIIRTATVVYLMAVLMAAMTGISIEWSILLAGGITAIYTVKGGFEAVVWTDVIQTVILVVGALVIIAFAIAHIPGGLRTVITEAGAAQKLSFYDLNQATGNLEPTRGGFSFTEKTTIMLMLVGFTQYIAGKLNQETVQRWCASSSAREAKKSMLVLGVGSIPIWASFMFMGTCLWVYYQHFSDPIADAILAGTQKAESILPHFIITALPNGFIGLVISAALAAAMSTLSSGINSASMVLVQDIYKSHIIKNKGERHYFMASRLSSLLISVLMIAGAFLFHYSNTKTINEFSIIITAVIGGGIAGAFLLGMFTRRGDARAVMAGILATVLFSSYAMLMQFDVFPRVFDPYYTSIIGNIVMIGVGYGASWIFKAPARDLTNLTVWDSSKESLV